MVRVVPTTLKQLISYVLPEGWLIIAKEGNVLADKWKSKRIFTPRWWRNPSASQGFSFCPCTDQLNKGLLHQLHRRAHAGARTYVYFPSFQPVLASEDTDRFRWVLACKGVQKKKKKRLTFMLQGHGITSWEKYIFELHAAVAQAWTNLSHFTSVCICPSNLVLQVKIRHWWPIFRNFYYKNCADIE